MTAYRIKSRFVNMEKAHVSLRSYDDGSTALVAEELVQEDGYTELDRETLSVNLGAYGMYPPLGHVYVRNYAEHEGLPQALADAGIVRLVEPITFGPFNVAGYLVEVTL